MSIERFEQDLASIVKAIEQGVSNTNVLVGQKQGLEHCIKILKESVEATQAVADTGEAIIEAVAPLEGEIVN